MPFLTKLKSEHVDGELWRLTSRLVYMSPKMEQVFIVPKGFPTDFASIPGVLLGVLGRPSGDVVEPSVLHDYLYSGLEVITRSDADSLFLEALESVGVGYFKRKSLYLGVRLGGWAAWNKNRKIKA